MKVLAFTDLHGNDEVLERLKKRSKDVDVVLMSGDLTLMGRDLEPLMRGLNSFHAPVLVIHGNHDDEDEMRSLCEELSNITFLHEGLFEIDGWWFGAYATHGLSDDYPEQEAWVRAYDEKLRSAKPLVWLDHPPPKDTALDRLGEGWHVGSVSLRRFIEEYRPRYVFCGHLHETFGEEDIVGETIIINSGPSGRVVELEE